MQPRTDWINEIQRGISDLIAKSPAADVEKNVRALMTQTFARMDLITREEFDTQVALLERALERIQVLEKRVAALESATGLAPAAADTDSAAADATAAAHDSKHHHSGHKHSEAGHVDDKPVEGDN